MNVKLRFFKLCVLIASLAMAVAHAEPPQTSGQQLGRQNSWSARSSTGRVLGGSWTGSVDAKTGAASGTWTLSDASGRPAMRGGWSAMKSAKEWSGGWRANVTGSPGEFSGTWRASVDQAPDGSLADMFALAARNVVSGSWRVGSNSGTWSIRVSASN